MSNINSCIIFMLFCSTHQVYSFHRSVYCLLGWSSDLRESTVYPPSQSWLKYCLSVHDPYRLPEPVCTCSMLMCMSPPPSTVCTCIELKLNSKFTIFTNICKHVQSDLCGTCPAAIQTIPFCLSHHPRGHLGFSA